MGYAGYIDATYCVYLYPLRVVTQFTPTSSNPTQKANCPSPDFSVVVDKHGAAMVQLSAFGPGRSWDPNVTTPLVTCVLQVSQ